MGPGKSVNFYSINNNVFKRKINAKYCCGFLFQIASVLFRILLIFTKARFMKNYNYLCWKCYLRSLSLPVFLKASLKGLVRGELTQPIILKHLVALEKRTFLHCQLINVLFFLYSVGVLKVGRVHFLICFF